MQYKILMKSTFCLLYTGNIMFINFLIFFLVNVGRGVKGQGWVSFYIVLNML